MRSLNPLEVPLSGLVLIEASAGTGKTYTIANLYLRLLLERGLEPERILVVTYTKAATEELRERIRRRVAQALEWLSGDLAERREEDPVLAELLLALPDPEAARAALMDALTRMDEAAIHTIHGFCQRALQDHAFESGAAFELELITEETRLRETAIADFWRLWVARAERWEAERLRTRWKTPTELLAELDGTLGLDGLGLLPTPRSAKEVRRELAQAFEAYQTAWRDQGAEVREILHETPALNRRSFTASIVTRVLDQAESVASSPVPPTKLGTDFARLTPSGLERGTKAGQSPPAHPFFDLCARLQRLVPLAERAHWAEILHAARDYLRQALERRKRDEGLLYFDDLLRRLDQALEGEGAKALAEALRRRHPVALIDEFQDTDPQQYRIFRRVYAGQPGCGLFLIGDPKQAIYAFRGADIFTYMLAKDDSGKEGQQYTLGINWRSGSRLITALNALFTNAPRPFLFEEHIGYQPIKASPKADEKSLLVDGVEPVPLQFLMLALAEDNRTKQAPHCIRKEAARKESAQACAERVADLLSLADAGRATLGSRLLAPGDIALLVRTHREGDEVQQALRGCGVNSVTLSQDSVFASEDAKELAMVLGALGSLHDEGLVRVALATVLLGHDAATLDSLARDEIAWEAVLARFQGYWQRWQEQGPLVAVQSLIEEEGVAERLLRRPDGERRLTNLIQLLELLQVASVEHPGSDGLLRWFAEERAAGRCDEVQQLRLESDEGLVKVITMHRSKGLEYPLVLIPFPWSFHVTRNSQLAFFHDQQDRRACLDLGSADLEANRALEGVEQLAERLRLFYVAVTRAARLCVLCWGKVKGAEGSALAYLLHPHPESEPPGSRMAGLTEEQIRTDLEALAERATGCILVESLPTPRGGRWAGPRVDRARLGPAAFRGVIDSSWRVSSYSALVRGADSEQPDHDPAAPAEALEVAGILEIPDPFASTPDPVFDLPSGTHVGHFLHEVFESLDFPSATGAVLESRVRALLGCYGGLSGGRPGAPTAQTDWTPAVMELVTQVLDTPLDESTGLCLRQIPLTDRLPELEFHFPVVRLDPVTLRDALADTRYGASVADLGFEPLRGLMRGYIDLVLRHHGRYYLVDYKSNLLGRDLAAYAQAGMAAAIREHRYDLQYLIYTLALHRLLRVRLPDYGYERHFGGVFYLFLRGMRPAQGARFGVWHDRPGQELVARLDRLFQDGVPGPRRTP